MALTRTHKPSVSLDGFAAGDLQGVETDRN